MVRRNREHYKRKNRRSDDDDDCGRRMKPSHTSPEAFLLSKRQAVQACTRVSGAGMHRRQGSLECVKRLDGCLYAIKCSRRPLSGSANGLRKITISYRMSIVMVDCECSKAEEHTHIWVLSRGAGVVDKLMENRKENAAHCCSGSQVLSSSVNSLAWVKRLRARRKSSEVHQQKLFIKSVTWAM